MIGRCAGAAVLLGMAAACSGQPHQAASGSGERHADPYGLPPELLDAMAGAVCGDGSYPDPRDPATIPGFGTPKRVAPPQSK